MLRVLSWRSNLSFFKLYFQWISVGFSIEFDVLLNRHSVLLSFSWVQKLLYYLPNNKRRFYRLLFGRQLSCEVLWTEGEAISDIKTIFEAHTFFYIWHFHSKGIYCVDILNNLPRLTFYFNERSILLRLNYISRDFHFVR